MNKFNIRLDVCTLCRLNCPTCSMRLLNYAGNKAGYLTFNDFKTFIDNNDNLIKRIEISNAGEPFLNPELSDILKYAFEKQIDITCNNASTLNFNNKKLLEAIVDYQVKSLVVAIDGVTQECYEKYRRNGNLSLVFENLDYLLWYKKQKQSSYPEIKWQYIIMENTDSYYQITKAKELASKLGIEIFFKLTWDKTYVPSNKEELRELTGLSEFTRQSYEDNLGEMYRVESKCRQLWSFPQINWNGDLLGCCYNRNPFKINVFNLGENGLLKALISAEFVSAKDLLLNKQTNIVSPCHNCPIGEKVRVNNSLSDEFILKNESNLNQWILKEKLDGK